MRDKFKYGALTTGRKERLALLKDVAAVRTKKLRPVVEAFSANVRRSSVLAIAFSEIALEARRDQACRNYAEYKTYGKIETAIDQLREPKSGTLECRREYLRQFRESQDMEIAELSYMLGRWGKGWVNQMVKSFPGMETSIESLMSSIVIESWATFENLTSDLWTRAINIGGNVLKNRLLAAHRGQWLTPEDNIGVRELGDVDTRYKFGSTLLDLGRVSFQRLEYIKRFYALAFGHDFEKLFKGVDNGYIKALSAIRNVLIHNAGKADKTFAKQVQSFPELRKIKNGKPVRLDGVIVKRLENVSHHLGAKLIHFVDDVLTPP